MTTPMTEYTASETGAGSVLRVAVRCVCVCACVCVCVSVYVCVCVYVDIIVIVIMYNTIACQCYSCIKISSMGVYICRLTNL